MAEYSEQFTIRGEGVNTTSNSSMMCVITEREPAVTDSSQRSSPTKLGNTSRRSPDAGSSSLSASGDQQGAEPGEHKADRTATVGSDHPHNEVIALVWDGVDDILLGTVIYDSSDQANIEVQSAPTGQCRGFLTLGAASTGTWTLACTSGITAHGTTEGRATNEIIGRGTDSRGRTVRFRLHQAPVSKVAG